MRLFGKKVKAPSASSDYKILVPGEVSKEISSGWDDSSVVKKQDETYEALVKEANRGNIRIDLQVAAKAISTTALEDPSILEVGCGSGYYSRILSAILKRELRYTGLDLSFQ